MLMCVIGCSLGVLLSFLAAHAFPSIPTIGNLISFRPSVGLIAPVIGAAFVLCALGALLPAWRAVRMLPAEALRRMEGRGLGPRAARPPPPQGAGAGKRGGRPAAPGTWCGTPKY